MDTIKIYKVTLPSWYAYPSWRVILKLCYSKEDAKKYIDSYPNIFMRVWLNVEEEYIDIQETD